VESCILRIRKKETPLAYPEVEAFFRFLDAAFSARRKMLVNALGGGRAPYCERRAAEEALKSAGFPLSSRAEELSCRELLEVFNLVMPQLP
jgi:16S rRNA A1518/A1519 N6-dimethyltransferase RsmA/KsgA/DIM1 with predicted DNA glycosylase/AP lyase activity